MPETPATPPAVTPPADPAAAPPAAPAPPAATPPAATPPVTGPPNPSPWDDPAAAKAEIERLRKENGAARTTAKQQAADEARNELAQSIGKALGIVKDEEIDPAKLTQELTASQTAAQQARVELAVFRAAGAVNGDPAALLDSTSFLKSLEGVDPNDATAISAAITSAVTANPRLGAVTDPRTPAPNPAQGAGAAGAPSLDSQIDAANKAGDIRLAIALKQERSAQLLQKP